MELRFSKYEGAGNDFVIVDSTRCRQRLSPSQLQRLNSRRTGIGADGVIVLEQSQEPGCSYKIVHYAGGIEKTLCGNGCRCGAAFAERVGLLDVGAAEDSPSRHLSFQFEACDGEHTGGKVSSGEYFISIRDVGLGDVERLENGDYLLDTGSKHYVRFVEDVKAVNVDEVGKQLRWIHGSHVDFVQEKKEEEEEAAAGGRHKQLVVRTYETGVEGETLACGTGATASAIAAFLRQRQRGPGNGNDDHRLHHHNQRADDVIQTFVTSLVQMGGGRLEVTFTAGEHSVYNIRLTGPVTHVYDGVISL